MRHLLDESMKGRLVASLLPIARFRLPAHVVQESGVNEELIIRLRGGSGAESDDKIAMGIRVLSPRRVGPNTHATEEAPTAQHPWHAASEREQLFRAMLVEPEVLHLAMRHEGRFSSMRAGYADQPGNWSGEAFLHLCQDFTFSPFLVAPSVAAQAYGIHAVHQPGPQGQARYG